MVGGLEDFFSPTRLGYVGMIIQSDELIFFQRGGSEPPFIDTLWL